MYLMKKPFKWEFDKQLMKELKKFENRARVYYSPNFYYDGCFCLSISNTAVTDTNDNQENQKINLVLTCDILSNPYGYDFSLYFGILHVFMDDGSVRFCGMSGESTKITNLQIKASRLIKYVEFSFRFDVDDSESASIVS